MITKKAPYWFRLKIRCAVIRYRYCIRFDIYDSKDYGLFATRVITELIQKGDLAIEEFEIPIKCAKKILRYYVRKKYIIRLKNTQPLKYRIINPDKYNVPK